MSNIPNPKQKLAVVAAGLLGASFILAQAAVGTDSMMAPWYGTGSVITGIGGVMTSVFAFIHYMGWDN